MKFSSLVMTALGVIVTAMLAIVVVLSTPQPPISQTDPAPPNFDQPPISPDPPAYGPLFRPSKQPCDGPDCPPRSPRRSDS